MRGSRVVRGSLPFAALLLLASTMGAPGCSSQSANTPIVQPLETAGRTLAAPATPLPLIYVNASDNNGNQAIIGYDPVSRTQVCEIPYAINPVINSIGVDRAGRVWVPTEDNRPNQ